MNSLQSQIETVFNAAQNCDHAERDRVIDELCGDDVELRSEVHSLLAAAERAQSFLEVPPFFTEVSTLAPPSLPDSPFKAGSTIGAYELLEEVGRGGMGIVFRAKRSDGEYDKEVAVKLLRTDFGTRNWDERFANEKQILANLNHPNIAQLLDGSTTEDGQSYLVMEYVEGLPVDDYCQQFQLSITDTLLLFKKICEAVDVAHSNLVVHRDLKPDNIIVLETGEPKLLDFGVAKLLSTHQNMTSGLTDAVPFTPEYAAPEQLSGGNITTATDIYALGILLWQLLTTKHPFSDITNIAELIKTITENKIPEPSAQASEPLRNRLKGDLDAITCKATNREPAERYSSVNHLITDIDNYLVNRPVEANQQGITYKARKFLKRNLLPVTIAMLFFVVLTAGSALSLWQWQIASSERDLSEQRLTHLRDVVTTMVFELPDQIVNYPGSEAVRADMTVRGVELLDLLLKQEPEDPTLLLDLANAYYSMARLQRGPGQADLGQTESAIASHGKSIELLNRLLSTDANDIDGLVLLARNYMSLTYLYFAFDFQVEQSIEYGNKCDDVTRSWPDRSPVFIDVRVSCLLAISFIENDQGHLQTAAEHLTEIEQLLKLETATVGNLPAGRYFLLNSRLHEERAKLASQQGQEHEAIEFDTRRLEIYQTMPAKQEKHKRRLIAWAYHQLGRRYAKTKQHDLALSNFELSLTSWETIHQRNSSDIPAIQNLAMVRADQARLFWQRANTANSESTRNKACYYYQLSVDLLNSLDDPLTRFPMRHRDVPPPQAVFAERAERCDG